MMLTGALIAVLLFVGCAFCCLNCRHRLSHYQHMAEGIRYIQHIEKILEHLPQHRGMANALLNGDKSFQEKMTRMQKTLYDDIKTIDQYNAQHTIHSDILMRWQTIKSGWSSLKQELQSLNADESFERHSALISEVLYLISDIADRTSLSNHPEPNARNIIQTTFNLLPPTIENIGQARGIGSGAAARGTLLTAVRIKLEFLHQRLKETANSAYSTIERSLQQNNLTQINRDNISSSQRQTEHFLETMAKHLLGDKISINAGDYFSEGTTAFNSNLALLGNITTTLDQQINSSIPTFKTHYLLSIILTAGGAVVLTLTWWKIAVM